MAEPSDRTIKTNNPSPKSSPSAICSFLQSYVILGGAISLLGWILNIPRLTDWIGNGISIQPNTTLAVMTAGAALVFLSRGHRLVPRILGVILAVIGGSALFQIATGMDLGIDTLLMFDREWGRTGVLSPGRMGPAGATSWTLLGIAFVLAPFPGLTARRLAAGLSMTTASIAVLGLVGYLYGVSTLYSLPHTTVIAFQTATFILAASVAFMSCVPDRGLMLMLGDPHSGGVFARRMLPTVLLVPILLGFFQITGERLGLHDSTFGSALRTVAEIIFFMLFVWIISVALTGHAKRRAEVAEELRASRQELRAELVDARKLQLLSTELIVEKNLERLYGSVLDAAVHLMSADFASIQMLYPERGELRLLAYRGFSPEAASFWTWVKPSSKSTCALALHTRERIIVSDIERSDINGTEDGDTYRETGIRAVQSTPLISRTGDIVGMISTHWRAPHEPLERELRLFDILARQAADLIERHRVEQEREELLASERAARASAEHAVRLKDDFLATLSHELRTPLHAVIGWAQILKKDLLEPQKAIAAAEVIERNARLQAQLITDLLDISRIVSGNMRLDLQAVDLSSIAESAIESIMPEAQAKGVSIARAIDPVPSAIQGDPARLQQVVWNLLSNAVKFTPEGGTVCVSLTTSDSHAHIRVEDTGDGIAPEFLPHIFQRFRQADPSPSRSHGGLGIGLAIVKQLVELHHGHIRADSEGIGKGSTFTIDLPFCDSRKVDDDHALPMLTPTQGTRFLQGVRALVIDDEQDALAMMRRNLEDQGAYVETASSAVAALDLLGAHTFDILISDIGMPGQDGYEFISAVRRRGIETPAVALTAFVRPEDQAKVLRSGYQAHASKPVDAGVLLVTLSTLLATRASSATLST